MNTVIAPDIFILVCIISLAWYLESNYGWELKRKRKVISEKHRKYFNLKP